MSFLEKLNSPLPSAMDSYMRESDFGLDFPGAGDDDELDLDSNIGSDKRNAFGVITGEDEPELSPEEDAEADKLINLAATPVVLKEELSPEEVTEFARGYEYQIGCDEGFLLEDCEMELCAPSIFTEAKFYNKNMVRMTKEARTNQLFEICVQAIARAKNDPIYWKLHKVQIARRRLKGMLRQKYKAQAMKKARDYLIRLRASKSSVLAKAASKMQDR